MERVKAGAVPADDRVPPPAYQQVAGGLLGVVTIGLGVIYLLAPPARPAGVQQYSVVAVLEPTLGMLAVLVGLGVVSTTLMKAGRSIAHGVAAVLHGGYLVALVVSIVLTEPLRPTVTADLAVAALIAHGGASLAYWQQGWK